MGRKGSEHIDTGSLIQLIISVHIPDAASSGGRKGSEHIDTGSLIQLIRSVHIPDAASSGARGRFGRQAPSSALARGNTGWAEKGLNILTQFH